MVAEEHAHFRSILLPAENAIELLGCVGVQSPAVISLKNYSLGSAQNAFVGGQPLHAQLMGDGEHFIGNTTLRRPHAPWTRAEHLLMQRQAAHDLLTRIFRVAEAMR